MGSPRNTLNYTVKCFATKEQTVEMFLVDWISTLVDLPPFEGNICLPAMQGMNTWCQSKCNVKQTDCPKHMCSCKPM
jgi:hypothetical protein